MNVEDFRVFCLSLPSACEKMPFTREEYSDLIAFTIADKWFCLFNIEERQCNLKCDPELVVELQEQYQGILPAEHMNKKHWITVKIESDVPNNMICRLVEQSYQLVYGKLTRAQKDFIQNGNRDF